MARYGTSVVSQTAQLAGVPSGTTVNGYVGSTVGSATAGLRLREIAIGILTTSAIVPVSQQFAVAIYRQTVTPTGTGLAAAVLGQPEEIWTPQTDPTGGTIVSTAATIGTTGPTIAANPIHTIVGNTQSYLPEPWEAPDDLVCNLGTANGFAYVLIGNTLPASHFLKLTVKYEV